MGFMDKVRSQATQLAEKAQEGLHTGKEKLDEMQERKRAAMLLHDLGAVIYRDKTGRGTASTSADVERLVSELKQIEDSGVAFLPSGNGAVSPPDQGAAEPDEPGPADS
jgi:hypothetical protein